MDSEAGFLRAKRRYKVLLREQAALAARGQIDAVVNSEIAKLVSEYPALVASGDQGTTSCVAGDASGKADAKPEAPAVAEGRFAPPLASKEDTPGEHPGGKTGENSADSSVPSPEGASSLSAPPTVSSATRTEERGRQQSVERSHALLGLLFLVQVFSESQSRSRFGPLNYLKVVLLSCLNAVAHRLFVDPCSTIGVAISPAMLCSLVHISCIFSLFLTRRGGLSSSFLLVYMLLDVVPSLALAFTVYAITMIAGDFAGAPPVSLVCHFS